MARFRLGNASGDPYTSISPNKTPSSMLDWETSFNASVIDQIDAADMNTGIYPWFNVMSYGATGDGTTDDTVAIKACIDAAEATGRGAQVLFPQGSYKVTATINIRKSIQVYGVGAGHDGVGSGGQDKTGTTVRWYGASGGGAIFDITSGGPTELIRYASISNMLIHGGSLASYGIRMSGASSCFFRDLRIEAFAAPGVACINIHNGTSYNQFNQFNNIITGSTGTDCCGLLIEGITAIGGNAQNMFVRCTFGFGGAGDTADGIRMTGNCDNNQFYGVHSFDADSEGVGGTGKGVQFIGDVTNGIPRNNLFMYFVGSIGSSSSCYGNTFLHCTAESFSVEAGATEQLNYQIIDNGTGGWYRTPTLAVRDELTIPLGSWVPVAKSGYTTPAFGGTHDAEERYGAIELTNSVKTRIAANICTPYNWGQGQVVGLRLFYVKQDGSAPTGTASRTISWTVSVGRRKAPTTGFTGIAMTLQVNAEALTSNVPDGEDNLFAAEITFATPVSCAGNEFWSFTIDRLGDDATNDTLSVDDSDGNLSFLGAVVKFEGLPSTISAGDLEYPRRGISGTE